MPKLTKPEERAQRANEILQGISRQFSIVEEIRAALKELVEAHSDRGDIEYRDQDLIRLVNEVLPEEEKIK